MQLNKGEVIDIVWQYSKYYGNQLTFLEQLKSENAVVALIYLTNLLENALLAYKDDYEYNFINVIKFAYKESLITEVEYNFLNDEQIGIRKLRNYFAHKNLSKYNFKFPDNDRLYPFTENDNCELFYDLISNYIFNIICKVALTSLTISRDIQQDDLIKKFQYSIVTFTPEDILIDKGIDPTTLTGWNDLKESDKYRHAENASNIKVLSLIFSHIPQ
ncbi:hypothetical protein SKM62_04565 [Acinetobacter faecalis]|uniref:Uncharacterized protein n=2 Tax=Acinetobacter faecalis TaxID=2665161 RepID=A0AB35UTQ0_9GAMM|nr:hypothetical protein [Acinetobacter faecalis]MDY6487338.1 hypothetical protein [Acinetobacter faecalis]MDY6536208.1 hypothetical protein [Acinetobacter faecalis]